MKSTELHLCKWSGSYKSQLDVFSVDHIGSLKVWKYQASNANSLKLTQCWWEDKWAQPFLTSWMWPTEVELTLRNSCALASPCKHLTQLAATQCVSGSRCMVLVPHTYRTTHWWRPTNHPYIHQHGWIRKPHTQGLELWLSQEIDKHKGWSLGSQHPHTSWLWWQTSVTSVLVSPSKQSVSFRFSERAFQKERLGSGRKGWQTWTSGLHKQEHTCACVSPNEHAHTPIPTCAYTTCNSYRRKQAQTVIV